MEKTYFSIAQLITAWVAGLVMGFLMRNIEVKPGLIVRNYMIPVYTGRCVGCTVIFGARMWRLHF